MFTERILRLECRTVGMIGLLACEYRLYTANNHLIVRWYSLYILRFTLSSYTLTPTMTIEFFGYKLQLPSSRHRGQIDSMCAYVFYYFQLPMNIWLINLTTEKMIIHQWFDRRYFDSRLNTHASVTILAIETYVSNLCDLRQCHDRFITILFSFFFFWFLFIFIFKSKEFRHCTVQWARLLLTKTPNILLSIWNCLLDRNKCFLQIFQQAICWFPKFIAHVIELTVWICLLLFIVINRNSENGAECLISGFSSYVISIPQSDHSVQIKSVLALL